MVFYMKFWIESKRMWTKLKPNWLWTSKTYIDGEHPLLVLHVLGGDGLKTSLYCIELWKVQWNSFLFVHRRDWNESWIPATPPYFVFVFGIVISYLSSDWIPANLPCLCILCLCLLNCVFIFFMWLDTCQPGLPVHMPLPSPLAWYSLTYVNFWSMLC